MAVSMRAHVSKQVIRAKRESNSVYLSILAEKLLHNAEAPAHCIVFDVVDHL